MCWGSSRGRNVPQDKSIEKVKQCGPCLIDQNSSCGSQVWRPSPCEAFALGKQGSHVSDHRAEQDTSPPGSGSVRAEMVQARAVPTWQSQFALIGQTSEQSHPLTSSQVPPNTPSLAMPSDGDSHHPPWSGVLCVGYPTCRSLKR